MLIFNVLNPKSLKVYVKTAPNYFLKYFEEEFKSKSLILLKSEKVVVLKHTSLIIGKFQSWRDDLKRFMYEFRCLYEDRKEKLVYNTNITLSHINAARIQRRYNILRKSRGFPQLEVDEDSRTAYMVDPLTKEVYYDDLNEFVLFDEYKRLSEQRFNLIYKYRRYNKKGVEFGI